MDRPQVGGSRGLHSGILGGLDGSDQGGFGNTFGVHTLDQLGGLFRQHKFLLFSVTLNTLHKC